VSAATTDIEGRFALPIPSEYPILLYADRDDLIPDGCLLKETTSSVNLTLREGCRLYGTVSGIGGVPLANARLQVRRDPRHSPAPHMTAPDEVVVLYRFSKETHSGPDGSWVFRGIPPGFFHLEASLPGYSTEGHFELEVPHGDLIPIILRAGATIEGQVTQKPDALPLPHVVVALQYPALVEGDYEETGTNTRTNSAGFYRIEGVRAGVAPVWIDVTRMGFTAAQWAEDSLAPGEIRIRNVTLVSGCRLRGKVQSKKGEPIDGASVFVEKMGAMVISEASRTDSQGHFTIPRLEPGIPINLRVEADGFAPRVLRNVLPDQEELVVTLPPMGGILGSVRSLLGPVSQFAATLSGENRMGPQPGTTRRGEGSDGTFAFEGLEPGIYRIRVDAPDHSSYLSDPVTVVEEQNTSVQVELTAGAILAGRVVAGRTGDPMAGVGVAVADSRARGVIAGTLGEYVSTAADGTFLLTRAPPGAGTLVLRREGRIAGLVPYDAPQGQTTRLADVRLGVGSVIAGRVTDPKGRPLSKVTVKGGPYWMLAREKTITDAEGRYELRTAAGILRIGVESPPFLPAEWARTFPEETVLVEDGERREVDFRLDLAGKVVGSLRHHEKPLEVDAVVDLRDPDTGLRVVGFSQLGPGAHYTIPGVRPGRYHVLCRSIDFALPIDAMREITVAEGETVRCDFDLEGGGIEGALKTTGGELLTSPTIVLHTLSGAGASAIRLPVHVEPDGSFASLGLSGGRYRLEARAAGCAPAILPSVEVPDDRAVHVEVELEPEASIALGCRRPDGSTASGVTLTLHRSGDPNWPLPAPVVTGAEGAASFRGLASGAYEIAASGEGIFPLRVPIALKVGENLHADLTIRRRGDLEILTRGADGSPRAEVSVTVIDASTGVDARTWVAAGLVGASETSFRTDASGRLTLTGLPEGTVRVGAGGTQTLANVPPDAVGVATITIP
jgi:carboxypeptidase family protein